MMRGLALRIALLLVVAGCTTAPTEAWPSLGPEAQEPLGRPQAIGCTDIEAGECVVVATRIVAMLPKERGTPFSVQIRLGDCADHAPCPRSLAVRRGTVTIEYRDVGEPISLTVAGPPQAPVTEALDSTWSGPVQPASARVNGPGPFVFEVGHCGLTHVVDFDGSFWVPVGEVDGSGNALINSELGTMRLTGFNLAEYRGTADFSVTLARWPGPKRFFLCA